MFISPFSFLLVISAAHTGRAWTIDTCARQCLSALPVERILFVGNSFTLRNKLPMVFQGLARRANKNVETSVAARGGASFNSHWHSIETHAIIAGSNWSTIVLQEQSSLLADAPYNYPTRSIAYSSKLYAIAEGHTKRVALYETWAYKNGNPTSQTGLDDNYDKMQTRLKRGYDDTLAVFIDLKMDIIPFVVYVGESWRVAKLKFDLYDQDGMHPTPHGTYLAACVFYVRLYLESPVGIRFTINGVSKRDALALQKIAWRSKII